MKMASKTKTILLVAGFAIFAILMFWFGYGIMGSKNQVLADDIAKRRVELEALQKEQKSFEQGKIDLAILEKADFPPDELFSRDTKVVKEIQQLEDLALRYNLTLVLSVAGNTKTAEKVKGTISELFVIPYNMGVKGTSSNILAFMQAIEHLSFVSHVQNVSIIPSKDDTRATLSSQFYIKK